MEATMEILSTEIIKPSSQTPHYLRKMKLSYLDQTLPPMSVPIVFFYQADERSGLTCANHSQISQHLKQSLSDTLTSFYPLAGTADAEDSSLVDCNDAGAEFMEAQSDARLADIIQQDEQNIEWVNLYVPSYPTNWEGTQLFVKTTFFKCGGISIGIRISHKFVDIGSATTFVNDWAATCRGNPKDIKVDFNLAKDFPARVNPPADAKSIMAFSDENFATKRFIFDEEVLKVLKREATSKLVTDPTRVEAVSAFIWMNFIETTRSKTNRSSFPAILAVSLRPRANPPLSLENVFGNCFMYSWAFHNTNSSSALIASNQLYHELVSKLRRSIRKINGDYIMRAQNGDTYLRDLHELSCMQKKEELMEGCMFGSWCGFPLYEVDYGWGTPMWVSSTTLRVRNFTILMNTRCGKGIEAWVNMEKDNLEMLHTQINLIS